MQEVFEKIITNLEAEVFKSSRNMIRTYAFEKAIEIVKQAAEEYNNGWIPVSERLPEKDGFYLATLDGEIVGEEKHFSGLAEFENGKWIDDEEDYQCVLAWKPLPAPYQPNRV